jgi:hypothetical protein
MNSRCVSNRYKDPSGKYWLRNNLSAENVIGDGFYDMGSAGPNLDAVQNFPPLSELQHLAVNQKREIVLVDWTNDTMLQTIFQEATENIVTRSSQGQLRQIAHTVAKFMGGAVEQSNIADFPYKFHISELKVKLGSNVIPIGMIRQGTFYHRALLFKAICDRLGVTPCSLVRGEFSRSWNVVDVRKHSLVVKVHPTKEPIAPSSPAPPVSKEGKKPSSRSNTPSAGKSYNGGLSGSNGINGLSSSKPSSPPTSSTRFFNEDQQEALKEAAIIDLMFEPGKLLIVGNASANAYQRM